MENSSCTSIDIWQVKIMNGIAKRKSFSDKSSENSQLISSEHLRSLLNRIKIRMDKKLIAYRSQLKKFASGCELNMFKGLSSHDTQTITNLICFYNLPTSILNVNSFVRPVNPLQFINEMKKLRNMSENDVLLQLWKFLEK